MSDASPAVPFAATFSRDIVGVLDARAPAAGEYTMSLNMSFSTFRTMEMRVSEQRRGVMRLTLSPDGNARACIGARTKRVVNGQPRYQPPEKREYREDEHQRLVALAGRWKVVDGVGEIEFDRIAWRTCDASAGSPTELTTLRCVLVAQNDRLPTEALVCEASERSPLLELGMPLSSSSATPPSQKARDGAPKGPHFVLATNGIHLDVAHPARAPLTFAFRAQAVAFVESDYVPKEEKASPKPSR